MRVIILEGARCTGKSTIGRKIREQVNYVTLINPTGFKEDGEEGLEKISNYYYSLMTYLGLLRNDDITVVFDRLFFSEIVFSNLYKNYDFSNVYYDLCQWLITYADRLDLFYLTVSDKDDIKERMKRSKVEFANVKESFKEIIKQQKEYARIVDEFQMRYLYKENVNVHKVDTTGYSLDHIEKAIVYEIEGSIDDK